MIITRDSEQTLEIDNNYSIHQNPGIQGYEECDSV